MFGFAAFLLGLAVLLGFLHRRHPFADRLRFVGREMVQRKLKLFELRKLKERSIGIGRQAGAEYALMSLVRVMGHASWFVDGPLRTGPLMHDSRDS